ncbi:MAG: cytochrome c [Acidobacteria bacterium]|nr:cytochrome c [Acidobacteriota bacterium]
MRCSRNLVVTVIAAFCCVAAVAQGPAYHLGRTPTAEEIRAWDIAIGPHGKELPPGSGTAKEGAKIYAQRCAVCHGQTAEGGAARSLVGGIGTLNTSNPVPTVGSFWPYATTVWDYINRAMPPPPMQPGVLSADEVYSVTAFLLYRNGIIQENDVLDAKSLPKIQMPNRNGFVPPRPEWKPGMRRPFGFYPDR